MGSTPYVLDSLCSLLWEADEPEPVDTGIVEVYVDEPLEMKTKLVVKLDGRADDEPLPLQLRELLWYGRLEPDGYTDDEPNRDAQDELGSELEPDTLPLPRTLSDLLLEP